MRALYSIFFCLVIIACGSPKKFYSKGNYEKAYTSALKELKSGKKDRSLKTILDNSLSEMIQDNKSHRASLLRSDIIEDWEEAYDMTYNLVELYNEGSRYIDTEYDVAMQDLQSDNNLLKGDILNSYVEMGDMNMNLYSERGDKRQAQEAYFMYNSALKYNHPVSIMDLRSRAEKALNAGTIFVDVIVDSWDARYSWDIEREFKNLEDNDELFYEISFDNWSQETDCQLEIDFSSLDKNIRQASRTENFVEEIEDGYRDQVDTSGNITRVPIYREVSGQLTIIEEIIDYNWDMRVRANNGNGYCDFRNNQFRVSRQVTVINYETTGDERAIPREYNANSNQSFTTSDERNLIEDLIEESFDIIEQNYF
jgi:hypothetical protein